MKFENQQHQQECVDRIMQCLDGVHFGVQTRGGRGGASQSDSDFDPLYRNLENIKKAGKHDFPVVKNQRRIDVLMETGTGKTFTYIKTILELNKRFGVNKFIIVLPRIAIKLGTIQNINLTKSYFYKDYQRHLNAINYPEDGLSAIRQDFIKSDSLTVLVTTSSAFASDKTNINKRDETLFEFNSTWEGIAAQSPVVIIDEPHLLKGEQVSKRFDALHDSLFIRFGATYPTEEQHQLGNVAYALDSITAFNKYLVKRIGVSTVINPKEASGLTIHDVKVHDKTFDLTYNINDQLHQRTIRKGDDLGAKTGLDAYHGISVTKIAAKKIFLSNQTELLVGAGSYTLSDSEIKQMIEQAITLHFQKEERLFAQGIKALSLFFIRNISDYKGDNPRVANIFDECYKSIRAKFYAKATCPRYKEYLDGDYDYADDGKQKPRVRAGYFSGDGRNKEERERNGVDIILNKKERLLSLQEPLRFIFSVWALQEGWDNPNIFTICKLAHSGKETSRRQQVGRGLRIAVNQDGNRLTYQHFADDAEGDQKFKDINELDMVVPGQEKGFIYGIQNEIQQASFSIAGGTLTLESLKQLGLTDAETSSVHNALLDHEIISEDGVVQASVVDFLTENRAQFKRITDERFAFVKSIFAGGQTPPVRDKNKKTKQVQIRVDQWQEFKSLWETINRQAKIVYKNIKQADIIAKVREKFNAESILPTTVTVVKRSYDAQKDQITKATTKSLDGVDYFKRHKFTDFIMEFAQSEMLPLRFTVDLFNAINIRAFYNNPQKARALLVRTLKETMHGSLLQRIGYEFNETAIYPNALQDDKGEPKTDIKYTQLGVRYDETPPAKNFLYDTVVCDSDIEKTSITDDPQEVNGKEVTVFAKLPKLSIPTPYKTYNPDFAYLIKRGDDRQLFLVVETKGYDYETDISADERNKIAYARKFFEALQAKVPGVEIKFETRLNQQSLLEILQSVA